MVLINVNESDAVEREVFTIILLAYYGVVSLAVSPRVLVSNGAATQDRALTTTDIPGIVAISPFTVIYCNRLRPTRDFFWPEKLKLEIWPG